VPNYQKMLKLLEKIREILLSWKKILYLPRYCGCIIGVAII